MPDYAGINDLLLRPGSFQRRETGTIGFVDAFGGTHNLNINTLGEDITQGELDALRNAVGDASNAGVYADGVNKYADISKSDARAVNDTMGSVSTVAVFVYEREDNHKIREYVELPAPRTDMLLKADDEWVVNADSAMAQAIITAGTNCFNASLPDGEPNFVFRRAYLSDRRKKKVGGNVIPQVTETFPVI